MAREALKAVDQTTHQTHLAKKQTRENRLGMLKGKKLKDLTAKEKDLLLKELAIRAGILDDDGED
jgi:hypothetical protein